MERTAKWIVRGLVTAFGGVLACTSGPSEPRVCGEATCTPVTEAYISHYTELNCQGPESYYTGYNNFDGVKRSWDGNGVAGTILRTTTHRSFKLGNVCDNAWPNGNTLAGFVRIYR